MNLICLICFHSCPGFGNHHLPRPHPSIPTYILGCPPFPVIVAYEGLVWDTTNAIILVVTIPGNRNTPTQSTHIHIKLHQRYFVYSKISPHNSTQPINLQGGAPYPAINETITPVRVISPQLQYPSIRPFIWVVTPFIPGSGPSCTKKYRKTASKSPMHVHHFIGRQVHHDLRKQNHFLNSISFSVTRGPGRKKHREVYVYHANILIQVVISNYLNNHSSKAVYFFPAHFFRREI